MELTSWDVASVTLSFLDMRLRATLRGFLGGTGKLASKPVGGVGAECGPDTNQ
jgi:hypothetical protein